MEVGLAVGGAVLSSALNVFFDRMSPKFPSLFRGVKDADQIFNELQTTLLAIEVVLEDAEDKQITNKHVKKWLNKLKDTVFHAEDLVDEINTEVLRIEVEEQSITDTICIHWIGSDSGMDVLSQSNWGLKTFSYLDEKAFIS